MSVNSSPKILLEQEMTGSQCCQLDHLHTSTSSLNFFTGCSMLYLTHNQQC